MDAIFLQTVDYSVVFKNACGAFTYAALKRRIACRRTGGGSRRIGRILDSGVDIDGRRHYF
jgi:hypothetical protein